MCEKEDSGRNEVIGQDEPGSFFLSFFFFFFSFLFYFYFYFNSLPRSRDSTERSEVTRRLTEEGG